jgi:hypothetical protein
VVAWLAQQMAKTPITGLPRVGWDTVGRIVARVVADRLDESRLAGLIAIGVDEISYRRGQRYGRTRSRLALGDAPFLGVAWVGEGAVCRRQPDTPGLLSTVRCGRGGCRFVIAHRRAR